MKSGRFDVGVRRGRTNKKSKPTQHTLRLTARSIFAEDGHLVLRVVVVRCTIPDAPHSILRRRKGGSPSRQLKPTPWSHNEDPNPSFFIVDSVQYRVPRIDACQTTINTTASAFPRPPLAANSHCNLQGSDMPHTVRSTYCTSVLRPVTPEFHGQCIIPCSLYVPGFQSFQTFHPSSHTNRSNMILALSLARCQQPKYHTEYGVHCTLLYSVHTSA